ncbi:S24/S26 family peptidase [Ferrimicrobium sp.]|uniref:S24/S26 family peptidase n=1 Tax=Ferrimicrobium sp. TaxID=2926050 RepID=UPI002624E87C|nr:S24/S26 family peptidase [Ferrimicrobium sp.]
MNTAQLPESLSPDDDSANSKPIKQTRQTRSKLERMARLTLVLVATFILVGGAFFLSRTNHSYVYTPSMYPTIPPGSMIFVEHESSYHVGEVIEFHANGLVWAHRLIAIKPNGNLVTKGDNPASRPDVFDPPLRMNDIIGKVVYAPKFLGFPQLFVHHPAYAWRWFVFELGVVGKVILGLAVGLLVWFAFTRKPKQTPPPSSATESTPTQPAAVE